MAQSPFDLYASISSHGKIAITSFTFGDSSEFFKIIGCGRRQYSDHMLFVSISVSFELLEVHKKHILTSLEEIDIHVEIAGRPGS